MANKSFGTKQLDLTGASGSPIITSPSDLSINATTVAISTNISVGGYFSSNVNVGTGYSVGIGTTIPATKLEVRDGSILVDAFGSTGDNGIFFRKDYINADSSSYNLSILAYDHANTGPDFHKDGLSINGYDGISFCTGSNTRDEKLRITSGGRLGLGVTTPDELLHIKSVAVGGACLELDQEGTYKSQIKTSNSDLQVRAPSGNIIFYNGNNDGASSTEKLTITSGGNVVCNGSPAYFQLPRVTTAQKNALSGMGGGEMVYDTDQNAVYFYQNTVGWRAIQHTG